MKMTRMFLRLFGSLRLAVFVLNGLGVSLAIATLIESSYDTATAQYWVYQTTWFSALLALFGLNIAAAALVRWPWKRRHLPFLLAHSGILLVLAGAIVTRFLGVDGSLRITEGDESRLVTLDEPRLVLQSGDRYVNQAVSWRPAGRSFHPVTLPFGLTLDRYLSHAESHVDFVEVSGAFDSAQAHPAIQLSFRANAAMAMNANAGSWLWAGAPEWQEQQVGLAKVNFQSEPAATAPGPWVAIRLEKNRLKFKAQSMRGERSSGDLDLARAKFPVSLDLGWKAVDVQVLKAFNNARLNASYVESRIQYGNEAPPSAIRLSTRGPETESAWLGLGDRAVLSTSDGTGEPVEVFIGYQPKRIELPFSVELVRFEIERYGGTMQPASYRSTVRIRGKGFDESPRVISMNEPLTVSGYTIYQSSYEEADPRPTVSIFSVGRDPGRAPKYLGSLFIVLGSSLLFYRRWRAQKVAVGELSTEGQHSKVSS